MANEPAIAGALGRLDQALLSLEKAIEKKKEKQTDLKGMQDDLSRLSSERSELATDLASQTKRADRLEQANEEVSRRLGSAMESVRAVLEQHGG
ncbi:DUF4164 family protein [Cohaesibacter gelatinilyticus]|uniref:DUF4164 family protein n=1 Tax=Cohaesibacter gelatinilyticus TaxID=372072 RepID=A0A285PMJ9_9HYPH|nr:DUF4164 family protein [Cohaesibacter gelatinilyticus]SNZ21111.1 protein of unknown function [Cohaesibacter gelatinilyticus]HAT85434.1 DUF4164 domain-containing protein [Hyphomicrobiales bacterium]